MEITDASKLNEINHARCVNSAEIFVVINDKSSEFSLKSDQRQSIDLTEFPNLSNIKFVESDSSKSSNKVSPPEKLEPNPKPKQTKSLENWLNSSFTDSIHDTDEEPEGPEKVSCSSEITELATSQYTSDRDIKSKSCCLCLIL